MGGSVIVVTHVGPEIGGCICPALGWNERVTEDLRESGLPARADAVMEYPFASVHEPGSGP